MPNTVIYMHRLIAAAGLVASLFSPLSAQERVPYAWAAGGICKTSAFTNSVLRSETNCAQLRVSRSNETTNISYGIGETRLVFVTDLHAVYNERQRRMELPVRAIAMIKEGQAPETFPVSLGWCEATDSKNMPSRQWLSCSVSIGEGLTIHGFYRHPSSLSSDILGGLQ